MQLLASLVVLISLIAVDAYANIGGRFSTDNVGKARLARSPAQLAQPGDVCSPVTTVTVSLTGSCTQTVTVTPTAISSTNRSTTRTSTSSASRITITITASKSGTQYTTITQNTCRSATPSRLTITAPITCPTTCSAASPATITKTVTQHASSSPIKEFSNSTIVSTSIVYKTVHITHNATHPPPLHTPLSTLHLLQHIASHDVTRHNGSHKMSAISALSHKSSPPPATQVNMVLIHVPTLDPSAPNGACHKIDADGSQYQQYDYVHGVRGSGGDQCGNGQPAHYGPEEMDLNGTMSACKALEECGKFAKERVKAYLTFNLHKKLSTNTWKCRVHLKRAFIGCISRPDSDVGESYGYNAA